MRNETDPRTLDLDSIAPPPHRLRLDIDPARLRELADDMAARGLLQRIRVHPAADGATYVICAGHRRYLAAQLLGWYTIPAEIAPPCRDCTDGALAENLQRSDLTPVEEARALAALRASGKEPAELARLARRSEAWVEQRLDLLSYPDDILGAVHGAHLPLAVAAILAQITHHGYRNYLLNDALAHGVSARTAQAWLQHYLAEQPRLDANADTVEQIAAGRDTYVVLAPCDYCGQKDDLNHTRGWRLCGRCHRQLADARDAPSPD